MPTKVEVSARTIIFILLILAGIWLLHQIIDIILLLFIAFILTSAINPWVDRLEVKGLRRPFAILTIYFAGLFVAFLVSSTILRPLITESIHLGNQLPNLIANLFSFLNLGAINPDALSSQIGTLGQNILQIIIGIFSNVFMIITILVFTFYFLLERKNLDRYLTSFLGEEASGRLILVIRKIEERLGAWVRGQLLLMLIIGVASFIGLAILQVEYALPLAILAGFLEIVPIIGPIIAAIPAIAVALALSSSVNFALVVAGLYIIIQVLENNLIVPTVMKKAVDLPPIVTLLALIIGGKIGGTGGAILAVPVVVTMRVILSEFLHQRKINA